MTPTEVLKMLKSKIDEAGLNKCNYAIEKSDIEAINQALLLHDVNNLICHKCKSDAIAKYPDYNECRICGNVW
jgi:hypothetical protein